MISAGEPLHRVTVGTAWTMNLYLVGDHGDVLCGPAPARLLPMVRRDEFLAAVAADLRAAPDRLDGPRARGSHAYGVLTCARGWATLTTQRPLSKSPDRDRPAMPDAIAASAAFARELLAALDLSTSLA